MSEPRKYTLAEIKSAFDAVEQIGKSTASMSTNPELTTLLLNGQEVQRDCVLSILRGSDAD